MFSYCISASPKSDDMATRLQLLSDYTTAFVFKSVSRQVQYSSVVNAAPWPGQFIDDIVCGREVRPVLSLTAVCDDLFFKSNLIVVQETQ